MKRIYRVTTESGSFWARATLWADVLHEADEYCKRGEARVSDAKQVRFIRIDGVWNRLSRTEKINGENLPNKTVDCRVQNPKLQGKIVKGNGV